MSGAGAVIEGRHWILAGVVSVELRGMDNDPDVNTPLTSKDTDPLERVRYVFRLAHVARSKWLQLIPGVNDQATDTAPQTELPRHGENFLNGPIVLVAR